MIQTKDFKLLLAVVFQVLVVLVLVAWKMSVLGSGTTVFLHVQPVDPRDPLRGDYVTVTYDISTVPQYEFREPVTKGETVYVSLVQNFAGSYWDRSSISKTRPQQGVFIKGVVEDPGYAYGASPYDYGYKSETPVRLKFGIEDRFIPEGTGRTMSFFNHEVAAEVVLDESGHGVLKNIYVDQKIWP